MDNTSGKRMMSKNRLIKRQRIFFLRRMVFIFLIFIIFLLVLINSAIFDIKYLKITGNKILSQEYITQELNGLFHKNILFYPIDSEFKTLQENKYIENIIYKRQYPNTLNIIVDETEVDYYIYYNNEYYLFDKTMKLVDIIDYQGDFKVLEVVGVKFSGDIKIGQTLFSQDSREVQWLTNLGELLDLNQSNISFDYVDLSDIHNVIIGYKDIKIKIGNNSDLRQKLNDAINIIESNPKFKDMKGYIDVRAKNYPVISLE